MNTVLWILGSVTLAIVLWIIIQEIRMEAKKNKRARSWKGQG